MMSELTEMGDDICSTIRSYDRIGHDKRLTCTDDPEGRADAGSAEVATEGVAGADGLGAPTAL